MIQVMGHDGIFENVYNAYTSKPVWLFHGIQGIGKESMAKAIAYEILKTTGVCEKVISHQNIEE